MKRFDIPQINTPAYWDAMYAKKYVDETRALRQKEYLSHVPQGAERVIELGCGLSPFAIMAKGIERIPDVWGLDYAPRTIQHLRDNWSGVTWVVGDALATPFRDGYFDVVVAGEILEHFEEPKKLLEEMNRICRAGGTLILSTAKVEFEDPEHLWEFDAADVKQMMDVYGDAQTSVIHSEFFPGRSYTFGWVTKK